MKKLTVLILLLAVFLLPACAYIPQAISTLEKVHDAELAGYEKGLCDKASSGAVRRRYGLNSPKAVARRVLCGYTDGTGVAK